IVLPVPLTYLALDGAAEMTRTVEMVRTRFEHPSLEISLVVPTFARNTKMASEILDKLRRHFPTQLAQTVLGYSVLTDRAKSRARRQSSGAGRARPPGAGWRRSRTSCSSASPRGCGDESRRASRRERGPGAGPRSVQPGRRHPAVPDPAARAQRTAHRGGART